MKFFCSRARCERQWKNVRRKRCAGCGGENTRLSRFSGGFKQVYVTPDIPEHWNVSLDQPVRSRRHLADLQKIHGCRDYEGARGADLSHRFGPGGEIVRVKHSEMVRA